MKLKMIHHLISPNFKGKFYIENVHSCSYTIVPITEWKNFISFKFIDSKFDICVKFRHNDSVLNDVFPFEFVFRINNNNFKLYGMVLPGLIMKYKT